MQVPHAAVSDVRILRRLFVSFVILVLSYRCDKLRSLASLLDVVLLKLTTGNGTDTGLPDALSLCSRLYVALLLRRSRQLTPLYVCSFQLITGRTYQVHFGFL